jgi:hypothetical protein
VALIPTLLAIGVGVALGLKWGGSISNLVDWRPPLWEALLAGVVLMMLLFVVPWSGWFVSLLAIVATGSLLAFAVVNLRVGGMVLVAAGLALNLLVTVVNWGMPVSAWALQTSGAIEDGSIEGIVLTGGRRLGGFPVVLGGAIPLPWGQVVSLGDLAVLVGAALVVASIMRRYEVGGGFGAGQGPGYRRRNAVGFGGPRDYRDALDALGRGPAPRRGPGLHPSRLDERSNRRRPPRSSRS